MYPFVFHTVNSLYPSDNIERGELCEFMLTKVQEDHSIYLSFPVCLNRLIFLK